MDKITSGIITVFTALVGVAIIATLVSKNANTANVVQSVAQGFAGDLSAAVSPVTSSFSYGLTGGSPIDHFGG